MPVSGLQEGQKMKLVIVSNRMVSNEEDQWNIEAVIRILLLHMLRSTGILTGFMICVSSRMEACPRPDMHSWQGISAATKLA